MSLLNPDTGLLVWQLLYVVSWTLSVLIIIRGSRAKDSRLLLFGAISFCVPLLMTIPYFLFSKK